jgi:hypothetical protein
MACGPKPLPRGPCTGNDERPTKVLLVGGIEFLQSRRLVRGALPQAGHFVARGGTALGEVGCAGLGANKGCALMRANLRVQDQQQARLTTCARTHFKMRQAAPRALGQGLIGHPWGVFVNAVRATANASPSWHGLIQQVMRSERRGVGETV